MIIKCRPFYLPREYTAILLVAVYIPPNSNNNRSEALNYLYQHISEQQTAHPDAFLILAGDFNHADLKSVFPKIYQHVDFPTRGKNTLDLVYTTQRGAYKALPLPHLGASDHITVMLMPAHRPLVKVIKPTHKQIQVWPEGSSEALQDCFETTDWNMFKQAATYNNTTDLQEYTETVTAYITKCIDDVTVTKTITVRANQKPWLTGEVYRLLNARNAAFRAGDEEGLRTARANLSRGIREAKRQYSRRIAHRFSDSRDTRSLWQGIQTITDYKPPPQTCDSTIPLLDELNAFFARFEAQNSTTAQKTPPPPGDQVMTLSSDSVRRSLSRINARKAPGPDNIPGRVLRDCAVELTDVFTDIFNISLSQAVVPTCFKATTIIPVPKKSSPSCFNDYRPVALTPIPMKCFERLVMQHIKSVLPPWTPSSLHIGPTARPMMPSPLPSTQPSHICNASCRKSLQRIVRAAEKIVGVSLPSLQDIYSTRLTRKALSIAGDPTHPTHSFFSLLPSGRRLRSLQARTSRLKDSFIHQAVRKLNSLPSLPPLPSFTPRNTDL